MPRVLKINSVQDYRVSLLFNNGESRMLDFHHFLTQTLGLRPGKTGYVLLEDPGLFSEISVIGTTVGWMRLGKRLLDENGTEQFYPYDLDPALLYEHSHTDEGANMPIGRLLREARLEAGLTQEELAQKSGTDKHYISRLENNKSDIELMTLRKIVEAGLGKELHIDIK